MLFPWEGHVTYHYALEGHVTCHYAWEGHVTCMGRLCDMHGKVM